MGLISRVSSRTYRKMLFNNFILPVFIFSLVDSKPEIDNLFLTSSKSPICNFCVDAVVHVKYGLDNEITRDTVEYGLKTFCEYLVIRPIIYVCKKQVHRTYQSILDLLESGVDDPNKVCEILKMCPNSDENLFQKFR